MVKELFARLVWTVVWGWKWEPYWHLKGYMNRWWLRKHGDEFPNRWWSCRVHQILRSDDDRHLHDHPWSYLTIIMRGGYSEVTDESCKWYGPGSILFRRHTHRHRLIVPPGDECWTLFFMGRWKQRWGFFTPKGKVFHEDYRGK